MLRVDMAVRFRVRRWLLVLLVVALCVAAFPVVGRVVRFAGAVVGVVGRCLIGV